MFSNTSSSFVGRVILTQQRRSSRDRIRGVRSCVLVGIALIALLHAAPVQADDLLLRDAVAGLVQKLDAADPADRDEAEKALIKLGHAALEYLPKEDDRDLSAEQTLRLGRIIPLLWESKAHASVEGSKVLIEQKTMLLSDFLTLFQTKTGNTFVDLRPDLKQKTTDPEVQLSLGEQPFWATLDKAMADAGFVLYPNQPGRAIGFAQGATVASPVYYSGAFRFRLDRVIARRDFGVANEVPSCQFDMTLQVEPRLHPIQIQLVGETCRAKGSDGSDLAYLGPQRAFMTFEDESIQLTIPLRFQSPPRSVSSVRELKGSLDVLLPSQKAKLQFDDLAKAKDVTKNEAGLVVTLREFDTSEEGVWAARLIVERKTAERETESHLQTEMKNELFLQASDGRRVIQDGGMNAQDLGDGRIEYEYLFVDVPGTVHDYKLVAEIPAGLVRASIPFEFTDVHLP